MPGYPLPVTTGDCDAHLYTYLEARTLIRALIVTRAGAAVPRILHIEAASASGALPAAALGLVPALMAVGATGFALVGKRCREGVAAKRRRMPFIAANGLLILVPSTLLLAFKAQSGESDGMFYAVQALALIAGAVNIGLLGLSLRDGLMLAGRLAGQQPGASA
jgi:hypothetical protein